MTTFSHNFYAADPEVFKAVYTQTTRGKEQLLFRGQPFIYEKSMRLPTGNTKKLWRCNQWCDTFFHFTFILCRLIEFKSFRLIMFDVIDLLTFIVFIGGIKSVGLVYIQLAM